MNMLLANVALFLFALKKRDMKKESLPSFIGIVEVKHYSTNRLRLRIPLLKDDEKASAYLKENLEKLPDVTSVTPNPLVASCLIEFDSEKLQASLLIGIIIKLLNLEEEVYKKKRGLLGKEISNFNESLEEAIYNKSKGIITLEELLLILLLGGGIYRVLKYPSMIPGGYTLLWWAHNYIRRTHA